MYVLFIIIHVIVSLVLCVAVLLQSSKGGGLAGAFGGGGGAPQQLLGSRGMTTLLHKVTIWCGIGFMVTSLALFMMSGSRPTATTGGGVVGELQRDIDMNQDATVPPIQDGDLAPAPVTGDEAGATEAGAAGAGTADEPTNTDPPQGGDK